MKILSATFVQSAATPRQFPPPFLPEVAFAGKSNVGKSSLLNTLLGRKNLVKTSSTPGKTQMINFFDINGRFHLVDLPGYGYAEAPMAMRRNWEELMSAYLLDRETLGGVVLILDVRHALGELDLYMHDWLTEHKLPALYVANKADKLKRSQLEDRRRALQDALGLEAPPMAVSARTGQGKPELWQALNAWLTAKPTAPKPTARKPQSQ